ncbi:hypothetical protein BOX15_Mlig016742g3, partial [Macrostomum lignano]
AMNPILTLSNQQPMQQQQHPRRMSALSLTSASDISSTTMNGACGAPTSAAWRSPATPLSAPTPDDELTCTPEDVAASAAAVSNGTRRQAFNSDSRGRRVTFVDSTPVRLPYRCMPPKEEHKNDFVDNSDGDAAIVTVPPSGMDCDRLTDEAAASGTAVAASVLAAPQRGTSLRLQQRLQTLRSAVVAEEVDDNVAEDLSDLPVSKDDPRLVEARSAAVNAAPGEQLFVSLRRLDLSAGSVERVAVDESAWSTRRPPQRFNKSRSTSTAASASAATSAPPDPTEHWRPEEAVVEPAVGSDDCLVDTVGHLLRPGMSIWPASTTESLASVMRRWNVGVGGGAWRRNCRY